MEGMKYMYFEHCVLTQDKMRKVESWQCRHDAE